MRNGILRIKPLSELEGQRFDPATLTDVTMGNPIMLRPENGPLRIGTIETPFAFADLPDGEDGKLQIFIEAQNNRSWEPDTQ